MEDFEQTGIALYAVTTDDEEHVREVVEKHGLTFPVLYGLDGPKTSGAWGSYYEERRNILHATAFLLHPDRKIASATYSTGPVGRLVAEDALNIVRFYQKQAAAT